MALDRYRRTGLKRWATVAVALVGAMPCFETFHALLMIAALGLWGTVSFTTALTRRRRTTATKVSIPWSLLTVPAMAGAAAFVSLQLLYLGERPVAPPRVVVDNVFGDSYRNTWEARARDDDAVGRAVATLDAWKRKPKPASSKEAPGDASPAESAPAPWYQHLFAKLVYTVGVPVYVFLRFVHLASFGCVQLWRKRSALRPSEIVIGSAALIGVAAPWFIDVGIMADGRWWSSPNLYRPTEFGSWLLALLGASVMLDLATHSARWKRPTTWILAAITAYWFATVLGEHRPATQYLEVPTDQLKTLAYLGQFVDYEAVVVHPWSDCVIRNGEPHHSAGRDAVAFVYKRHFTLGSNLAGRTMFYEGREDYTFSNGFISPDEVYERSRARKAFYFDPESATQGEPKQQAVAAVLDFRTDDGRRVEFVVDDMRLRAPEVVRSTWPVVYRAGEIVIRRRPNAE